ncbi:hypothetical protein ACFFUB_00350 [Algimonas porphyrae]|uniref:Uncharacterized protein n=1 Tax=Algimonas porphyrae TaxID=1128113 RepID=A0ABQ5UYV0_9PROT|nr:hypothetical protein [Algimonas porphyrae]GLQ20479.1 hypothetical protein GCM10007854_14340 [Algimonas porphyrae]
MAFQDEHDAMSAAITALDPLADAIAARLETSGNAESLRRLTALLTAIVPHILNDEGPSMPILREGEPVFMLCGRDPVAAPLIEAWAYLRSGHVVMAQRSLEQVMSAASHMESQGSGDPQILSAFRIARDCRDYQLEMALGTGRASTADG